jgi:hypothetical protein
MQKHTWLIIGIVGAVVLVGFLTLFPIDTMQLGSDSLAGNVVLSQQARQESSCKTCEGNPVCAIKDQKAVDYKSACHAKCDGAAVIYNDYCASIPVAQRK